MSTNIFTKVLNFLTHLFLALGVMNNVDLCKNLAKTQNAVGEFLEIRSEQDILTMKQLRDMQKQINDLRAEVERLKQE